MGTVVVMVGDVDAPDAAPIQPPRGLRRTPHRVGWSCGEGQDAPKEGREPAAGADGIIAKDRSQRLEAEAIGPISLRVDHDMSPTHE